MGANDSSVKFEANNFVVAFGYTLTDEGTKKVYRVLAKIVAVGEKDLFAESEGSGRVFKISKSRCVKVPQKISGFYDDVLTPQIGDLVVSVADRFSGREQRMGLLIEINDVPGKLKTAKLLEGENSESVPFDTLIVVERCGR